MIVRASKIETLDVRITALETCTREKRIDVNRRLIEQELLIARLTERLDVFEASILPATQTGLSVMNAAETMKKQEKLLSPAQEVVISILKKHPEGISRRDLIHECSEHERGFTESVILKSIVGFCGSLEKPGRDSLFEREPRLKTELRLKCRTHQKRGPPQYYKIEIRWFWLEPEKQKPVKYPPVKI